jgi:hypothetical protein
MRCVVATIALLAACARAPDPEPTPPAKPAPAVSAVPSPVVVASSSSPPPTPAAPAVDVRSIGMHIGGGPNDDANKAPLLASIAPHHEALGRCWESLPNKPKLELGIDADVPAKGGRAKISNPRSTVKDATFLACAVAVFEKIEFLPPKSKIDTTVSTSVRMTPR